MSNTWEGLEGKKMSGQMGMQKTVRNLEVVQTDIENNLIYIKGAVLVNWVDIKAFPFG